MLVVLGFVLSGLSPATSRAQAWPYGGMMPSIGAMSYDIALTSARGWSRRKPGLRMTGYASSRDGMVRWVHCLQSRTSRYRICQLMISGKVSSHFPLPPNVDLVKWLSSRLGLGQPYGLSHDGMPSGHMETSGEGRWGSWNAKGRFRYWR